jgi:sugar O-acyltransferase (sialic acid O-acetyltransferase NeuD family)
MARIVLFGSGLSARLAHFYLTHDSEHEVVAFSLDATYIDADNMLGLPVVPFEHVLERYPVDQYKMLVALGYGKMNAFRAQRYADARQLGYELISYVSSRATVWPGVEIGDNCVVMEDATIQPFAKIGNDVTIWSAGHIGHGSSIGDHVFVSSHVVVAGDATVRERCFLGVNATIIDGVEVASENVIGAGALIEADTNPREVYSPAKTIRLPITSDRIPAV